MSNTEGKELSSADQLHSVGRSNYDWKTTTPSIAIVETIASIENTDPTDLWASENRTLRDFVDPDALDALVSDDRGCIGEIVVSVDRYTIRIDDRGLIVEATATPG